MAYVYLMASRPHGALYLGSTTDLSRRTSQHKQGKGSLHTATYGHSMLVWYQEFPSLAQAQEQERRMKKWKRRYKEEEIAKINPNWDDLSQRFNE